MTTQAPGMPRLSRPTKKLTTHAERVDVSRRLPPPSAADIIRQARRLLSSYAIDDGERWRAGEGLGLAGVELAALQARRRDQRLELDAAIVQALVDLRDGWLERPTAWREVCEARDLLAEAAEVQRPAGRGWAELDEWAREQPIGVLIAVCARALARCSARGEA